ncbi:MAG TPA: phosphate acyltransferase, partial [Telluria sp.]
VFAAAKSRPKRVLYAEGEDERVLRAVQTVVDERLASPLLIGRRQAIEAAVASAGLRLRAGFDYAVVEACGDTTVQAAQLLNAGDADALICGLRGSFDTHLEAVRTHIGMAPGETVLATMNALILEKRTLFVADTYVNDSPGAEELAAIARLAAREVRHFGMEARVALVSPSMFGAPDRGSAQTMTAARRLLKDVPDMNVLDDLKEDGGIPGEANLLLMPSLAAANIAFNLLKVTSGKGVTVGPVLLGAAKPVHILGATATVRRIINMTALAVANVKA